jgi:hypothetical protein
MASFQDYRRAAEECARLAHLAPTAKGRQSFAAAASHWALMAEMADESGMTDQGPAPDWTTQFHAQRIAERGGASVHR